MEYPDKLVAIKQEYPGVETQEEQVNVESTEEIYIKSEIIEEDTSDEISLHEVNIKHENYSENECSDDEKKEGFDNEVNEEEMSCEWNEPASNEPDPLTLIPVVQYVSTKCQVENANIIIKRERDELQQKDYILQVAATHNSEIEKLNNDPLQGEDIMDITENLKMKAILRKRELARQRSRKYREKKSRDLTKNDKEILRKKKEVARERARKYREKKLKLFTEDDEETLRQKKLARERARKYREKKSTDLTKDDEKTLRKKELARERARKYREKKLKLFIENDEETLRQKILARERARKYREKRAKELAENDQKILHIRELARERSRKYRKRKSLEKFYLNVVHNSQITDPSRLLDNTRLAILPTLHDSQVARPPRMPCSPIHMDNSSEPDSNFSFTESTITKPEIILPIQTNLQIQHAQSDLALGSRNIDS